MNNELLNIYCVKMSKDEKKVILTLVRGEGEKREYFNACIKLDSKGKVQAKVFETPIKKECLISVPFDDTKK